MWTSIWRTKTNAKCEFLVYVSTDATADAVSCSTLAVFISAPEDSTPVGTPGV